MTADVSELRQFAADLRNLPSYMRPEARKVIEKGGVNIKTQLRQEMQQSTHFKQVARSISYDIRDRADSIELEVGPVKGSPGSLANIAYFGGSRGGGTVPDPELALKAEVPNLERYLADLVVKAMR
ncbi:hypothetical protein GCM10010401_07380 [Rarobacter faecitabidus]|uniref:hypothetical protein n=1 Tax=Rarobacter faecitabidus TaxID=13243 RepID=UPI0031DA60C3